VEVHGTVVALGVVTVQASVPVGVGPLTGPVTVAVKTRVPAVETTLLETATVGAVRTTSEPVALCVKAVPRLHVPFSEL
jgi:hypothetical protein